MDNNPLFKRECITIESGGPAPRNADVQAAIDAVAGRGGGTVLLEAGEFLLWDTIRLRPDVRLAGTGEVILRRPETLAFAAVKCDVDVGEFGFSPDDPDRFEPGMGVCFHDRERGWSHTSDPLTVVSIVDGRAFVHEMNLADRLAENGAIAVNAFPMVLGIRADRALVENLTIDAAVTPPADMPRIPTHGLYLYRSRLCTLRNLIVRNAPGDGICFGKASLHTTIEACETHHNGNYGIHPGSHSAHCTVRECRIHNNASDGLYICWGIHHSLFADNEIYDNGLGIWRSGISIGHKDTDNRITGNRIHGNAKYGICIRPKTQANGAHRNTFENNRIENNGRDPQGMPEFVRRLPADELVSCGIHINGITDGIVLERNTIRETRSDQERWQRHAIIIDPGVTNLTCNANTVDPHPGEPILDTRSGKTEVGSR